MKRSRFSDEQIIGLLKEQEAGAATADICRRHGLLQLGVLLLKRLKPIGPGHLKATKLGLPFVECRPADPVAEAMLDIAVLKDISTKKW